MTDLTYDPSADAAYIGLSRAEISRTDHAGPFTYDLDAEGGIVGIEILDCRRVLAPGSWQDMPLPSFGPAQAVE